MYSLLIIIVIVTSKIFSSHCPENLINYSKANPNRLSICHLVYESFAIRLSMQKITHDRRNDLTNTTKNLIVLIDFHFTRNSKKYVWLEINMAII